MVSYARTHSQAYAQVVWHLCAERPGTAASSSAPFLPASMASKSLTRSSGVHACPLVLARLRLSPPPVCQHTVLREH